MGQAAHHDRQAKHWDFIYNNSRAAKLAMEAEDARSGEPSDGAPRQGHQEREPI
jgi:hypothetical protein